MATARPAPRPNAESEERPRLDGLIADRREGAVVVVQATPKSGVNAIVGIDGDALRVRVAAAAVDGAANAAIVKLLADAARIPKSRVRMIAGQCARRKRILFEGLTASELAARLNLSRPESASTSD